MFVDVSIEQSQFHTLQEYMHLHIHNFLVELYDRGDNFKSKIDIYLSRLWIKELNDKIEV